MSLTNIAALFSDIVETPQQRQQRLLAEGQASAAQFTGLPTGIRELAMGIGSNIPRNVEAARRLGVQAGLPMETQGEVVANALRNFKDTPQGRAEVISLMRNIAPTRALILQDMFRQRDLANILDVKSPTESEVEQGIENLGMIATENPEIFEQLEQEGWAIGGGWIRDLNISANPANQARMRNFLQSLSSNPYLRKVDQKTAMEAVLFASANPNASATEILSIGELGNIPEGEQSQYINRVRGLGSLLKNTLEGWVSGDPEAEAGTATGTDTELDDINELMDLTNIDRAVSKQVNDDVQLSFQRRALERQEAEALEPGGGSESRTITAAPNEEPTESEATSAFLTLTAEMERNGVLTEYPGEPLPSELLPENVMAQMEARRAAEDIFNVAEMNQEMKAEVNKWKDWLNLSNQFSDLDRNMKDRVAAYAASRGWLRRILDSVSVDPYKMGQIKERRAARDAAGIPRFSALEPDRGQYTEQDLLAMQRSQEIAETQASPLSGIVERARRFGERALDPNVASRQIDPETGQLMWRSPDIENVPPMLSVQQRIDAGVSSGERDFSDRYPQGLSVYETLREGLREGTNIPENINPNLRMPVTNLPLPEMPNTRTSAEPVERGDIPFRERNRIEPLMDFVSSFENAGYGKDDEVNFSAYEDGVNPDGTPRYSIAYGTPANKGDVISNKEGRERLAARLLEDEGKVKSFNEEHNFNWNENQIKALTSFVYNAGIDNLKKLTFHEGRKRTSRQIANAMQFYIKKKDGKNPDGTWKYVVVDGLQRRRAAEAELFNTPFLAPGGGSASRARVS